MKVLFAVNNDKISESIIKRYQKNYKEIISGKNVYYFNAILKELQKDKSYDRIVISEDLEPLASDDKESIDKFLFDKLDKISDEAYNTVGNDIPIILIGTDRRTRPEEILVKLFGIGIYNTLIGQDRSIDEVCELISKPRSKKEAKIYYKIDSENVEYKPENESDVSETEIQNILAHYKRLGKDEAKYISSFDSIVSQYNDEQLKLIINFLPKDVKKVLEKKSVKYRSLMGLSPIYGGEDTKVNSKNKISNEHKLDILDKQLNKPKLSSPVIIPGSVNTKKVKKIVQPVDEKSKKDDKIGEMIQEIAAVPETIQMVEEKPAAKPVKRGRGRPPKNKNTEESEVKPVKRGRGRPPKKIKQEVEENHNEITELPGLDDEDYSEEVKNKTLNNTKMKTKHRESDELPGLEDEERYSEFDNNNELPSSEDDDELPDFEEDDELPGFEDDDELPGYDDTDDQDDSYDEKSNYNGPIQNVNFNHFKDIENVNSIQSKSYSNSQMDLTIDNLLTGDKKLVSFIGTSKNGTSFLVNNLAQMLSEKGIKTAILDLSQNRNAYYVYTDNQEELRNIAYRCIENLKNGIPEGININKNLTVYTSLPDDIEGLKDSKPIIETLLANYSLILLDCDYTTDFSYFNMAQEIYLVQSLDVLTIQPLTAFLRELKAKNILDANKLRIVINKHVKSEISNKMLIGGMSSYNDPSMSYMTELFDRDKIKYLTIPFEIQTYSRYLDALANCKISLKGYSKIFLKSLEELGNMVFPLIGNSKLNKQKDYNNYNNYFSKNTNNTLSKMKNRY